MSLYDVEQNIVGRAQRRNDIPEGGLNTPEDFAAWIEQELRRNPSYQMPRGYSQGEDGQVTRDQNWLWQNPWVFPAAGVGAGLAGGAAAGAGFFAPGMDAAAAAGNASVLPSATTFPTSGTLPAGGVGLGEGGSMVGPAAGSAGGGLPSWLGPAIAAGVGVAGRQLSGGGGGGNQIPIPPELQQLLTEATRRTMNQGPLSDAVTQQALASLPSYARR